MKKLASFVSKKLGVAIVAGLVLVLQPKLSIWGIVTTGAVAVVYIYCQHRVDIARINKGIDA